MRLCSAIVSMRSPLTQILPPSGRKSPRMSFKTIRFTRAAGTQQDRHASLRHDRSWRSSSTTCSSNANDTFSNTTARPASVLRGSAGVAWLIDGIGCHANLIAWCYDAAEVESPSFRRS